MDKTGFSMEQHKTVGTKLCRMHNDLVHLQVGVSKHYPYTTGRSGKVVKKIQQMLAALSTTRSELEELMAKECPEEWTARVYYPGAEADPELEAIAGK